MHWDDESVAKRGIVVATGVDDFDFDKLRELFQDLLQDYSSESIGMAPHLLMDITAFVACHEWREVLGLSKGEFVEIMEEAGIAERLQDFSAKAFDVFCRVFSSADHQGLGTVQ